MKMMDQRLHAAKRSVRHATNQAYSAVVSSNSTILANDDHATATASHTANDDDGNDNDTTRSGMDLGLALFGTSQSYKNQIEEEFNDKLFKVERELEDIRDGLASLDNHDGGGGGDVSMSMTARPSLAMASNNNNDDSYSDDYGEEEDGNDMMNDDLLDASDIPQLQAHISFLQQCASARKLLEDVDTLSLSTNFATSSWDQNQNSSRGDNNGTPRNNGGSSSSVTFPFSPSSLCSPTDFGMFTFESASPSAGDGGAGGSPFVRAAKLVKQTEEILEGIMMNDYTKGSQLLLEGKENCNNTHHDDDKSSSQMVRIRSEMLNELRTQTRRKKMELRHRAVTLVEGCVTVQENGFLVRGGGTTINIGGKSKSVAFDVGESPIFSASTHNAANDDGDGIIPIPPSPLSDAYQVLEIFTDSNFPTFGETLDGTMKKLSEKLFEGVLRPCLGELLDDGKRASNNAQAKRGRKGGEVGYYKFTQEALKKVRSSGSSGGDRRYDPVSIKGPAVQLEWALVSSVSLDGQTEQDENDNASTIIIATADEVDERSLRSITTSLTPSLADYLVALNFLTNFFTFVHEHVLLRRSDLSAMLGKHLFGIYPIETSTLNETSAILGGGVLVGAAAHGIQEGEEQPLMTLAVEAMRRLCIPKDSSPEVWRMLRKVEECLVREVGAFEGRMAAIGLMNDSSKGADGVGVQNQAKSATATASSPTGLSVLLNNESNIVESPTHSNATLSNLSTLDTSFPPNENKKHQTSNAIIYSPLSELAHSLRQAYVESRRSSILNFGRNILLKSDYHDTVQEGTFVPDLSEAGTLASLDDDLLKSTFSFHKCSISKMAKEILDLCRKTLDDSTEGHDEEDDDLDVDHIDSLRPMLYRASRELLDLFRAIIPSLYASEVGSIPRTAAVLHNDCVFLAHESLLLGAEYKGKYKRLQPSSEKTRLLGEVCTFVDMVPPFRDLATKSMGAMIELQKGQVYELVTPRLANFQESLSSNESVPQWDDAHTALRASLYHLRHLSQAWSKVLSRSVYHMSMGNMADVVITLFLDPVLKAEAITESASRFVHSLFLDMARGAAEMFLVGGDGGASTSVDGHDGNADTFTTQQQQQFHLAKKYSTLFDKSQAVCHFMPMRLDEIQRGLEEGAFRSVTARELSHLIESAFDESEKRRVLLNALAAASK